MITQIKGRLIEKSPTNLVIDCNGIGYDINISLNTLFGNTPKVIRKFNRSKVISVESDSIKGDVNSLLKKVLRNPTVAGKSFLITIADRSITGLVSRDQMVGPWQVPVADNSGTLCRRAH